MFHPHGLRSHPRAHRHGCRSWLRVLAEDRQPPTRRRLPLHLQEHDRRPLRALRHVREETRGHLRQPCGPDLQAGEQGGGGRLSGEVRPEEALHPHRWEAIRIQELRRVLGGARGDAAELSLQVHGLAGGTTRGERPWHRGQGRQDDPREGHAHPLLRQRCLRLHLQLRGLRHASCRGCRVRSSADPRALPSPQDAPSLRGPRAVRGDLGGDGCSPHQHRHRPRAR
mmetsp:Transcript_44299/g.139762  ORF Transcript_44299/g.139762 Transcript_44299/m.139762 type:complete len:226 (+) Transcript_44299:1850-2527(+)